MYVNFDHSQRLLERALKVIPNGTQTFSKSQTQYPIGAAPLYVSRAEGSRFLDADGHEYIDFVAGLGAIILGYCDKDVDLAVKEQMKNGSIFSLPSAIEIEVSEMLCDLIPCAEMVRFGKNGSDATSGAVRLARYITGRDHVLTCEGHYHGWQDWCNGITARNGGVPQAVTNLTHTFRYNDIDSLIEAFRVWPDTACVIMEPMAWVWPEDNFLHKVRDICQKNGAVFILDEMLTGFRFALGGAQEYFGVTPDLACFGKAMANGYPISSIVGRADMMRRMSEIHFSFTFGGDCIALAAAKATIKKLKTVKIPSIVDDCFVGHPKRPKFDFSNLPAGAREKIFQHCYENGILILDSVNLMASHTQDDINYLLSTVHDAIENLDKIQLKGKRIETFFKVRS